MNTVNSRYDIDHITTQYLILNVHLVVNQKHLLDDRDPDLSHLFQQLQLH